MLLRRVTNAPGGANNVLFADYDTAPEVVASGNKFHAYSAGTVLLLIAFGAVAGLMAGPGLAANEPTLRMGLTERESIYAQML